MSNETEISFYDRIMNLKFLELKQLYAKFHSDGWELSKERQGVKLYTKTDEETGIKVIRGEGIVDAPASKILEAALNVPATTKWDDTLEDRELIKKLNQHYLMRNVLKRIGFTQKREAFTVFNSFLEPDGTLYGVATSIDHPSFPANKDYVRAQIKMAGWILKPLPENPNKTFFTYILNADPRGWIPKHIINWLMEEQGMTVRKLGDFVEKSLLGEKTQ